MAAPCLAASRSRQVRTAHRPACKRQLRLSRAIALLQLLPASTKHGCHACAGGVARNVAEALALLLQKAGGAGSSPQLPLLVSVVGDDLAGRALLQHWRELG